MRLSQSCPEKVWARRSHRSEELLEAMVWALVGVGIQATGEA